MTVALWFVIAGLLLVGVALAISTIRRLPLTTALIYLFSGWLLGPNALGILVLDAQEDAGLLEVLSEVAVIVSLFSAGLKLRAPLGDPRWRTAMRLAFGSMTLTVGLVAAAGVYLLGLPLGAAVLLGAIIAPTDPVLASDVQVGGPFDSDPLRFSLTGEAGFNDGTAFPFVMLGLGLLGLHEIGGGWRWVTVDVLWAVGAGLGVGALLGTAVGQIVLYLRRTRQEAVGSDDFIAVGLIALSYGVALLCHAYGFLAVFAAGLALRRIERRHSGEAVSKAVERAAEDAPPAGDTDSATHAEKAPAYMTESVRHVTEHLERLGEIVVVLVVGALLTPETVSLQALLFGALLLLVIRPGAVVAGLVGQRWSGFERGLLAWFGIRGIGSIYYLMFAIEAGIPDPLARQLTTLVLTTVALSTIVHGATVTALMTRYAGASRRDDLQRT